MNIGNWKHRVITYYASKILVESSEINLQRRLTIVVFWSQWILCLQFTIAIQPYAGSSQIKAIKLEFFPIAIEM